MPLSYNKNIHRSDSRITEEKIIRVIGFGNKYRSDDGIGICVIEELIKSNTRLDVEFIDGGTSGVDLLFYLQNSSLIIIIDAIDAGQAEEEIVVLETKDIKSYNTRFFKSYSLHDFDLGQVLELSKKINSDAKIIIIGVKPLNMDFGEELSPGIKKKIPEIIKKVKELI